MYCDFDGKLLYLCRNRNKSEALEAVVPAYVKLYETLQELKGKILAELPAFNNRLAEITGYEGREIQLNPSLYEQYHNVAVLRKNLLALFSKYDLIRYTDSSPSFVLMM